MGLLCAAALIPIPMLPALPMLELNHLPPVLRTYPQSQPPLPGAFPYTPWCLHTQLQNGAQDCTPVSPFSFFLYKSSSNMLQDPTCQRPFPAACSPDIKPQQQGNEDPCREKETMRGWKWQRRASEGPEEQGRASEGPREAGQDPRRSGVTVG